MSGACELLVCVTMGFVVILYDVCLCLRVVVIFILFYFISCGCGYPEVCVQVVTRVHPLCIG